ncbi:MAG: rRNA pseudouridine synthase [Armatimonadetes bacterium]|nr:rRNA pseudouridine synthase [Armatimonadota bacterium]
MRLHRYIAQCGVTSRRKAEELIREGVVAVNGTVVTDMGVTVDPDADTVEVEGRTITLPRPVYVLFNKPRGVVTTLSDELGRPTVRDYFPLADAGLKPVGRLDMDTEGLLILTNDGDLAARLTHPRYGVEKEYEATVRNLPDDRDLARLEKGIRIDGAVTAPARADVINYDEKKGLATVTLVIHEGRKHQVRLMFEAVGHPVVALRRTRIGKLRVKGMTSGEARRLGAKEVETLRKAVGLA